MKLLTLAGALLVLAASCVTINIYFPAEEVRHAADKIVNEVWERAEPPPEPPAEPKPSGDSSFRWLGPASAHAAQDIEVSTPEIRAIKASIKQRFAQLRPYLDSGHVGLGADGLLKVRTAEGLGLRARGEVNRLVAAENEDRLRLYGEIARANGFPDRVGEVQAIFAESWRDQADPGWYLEQKDGSWTRK
ncbi:MAG: YdbL family protein [Deferrisomatales bacterium]